MHEVALRLADIGITFARAASSPLELLRGFDESVSAGELVCVVGRSGSGKTSILRVALGLATPTVGTVSWWGRDIAKLPERERRDLRRLRMGFQDQEAKLLAGLDVLSNVVLPVLPDGRRAARQARLLAVELLERVGLADRMGSHPHQLSGGERSRVVLARALLADPDLLVCDEPTSGLDRATADQMIDLLMAHAGKGRAVLVASHDSSMAAAAHRTRRLEE